MKINLLVGSINARKLRIYVATVYIFFGTVTDVCLAQRLIEFTDDWKYTIPGTQAPPAWNSPNYNDAGWDSGAALFFTEDIDFGVPKNTRLSYFGRPTIYFRKQFSYDDLVKPALLLATFIADDGAVLYLNGVEVNRFNISAAATPFFSTKTPAPSLDRRAVYQAVFSSSQLINGENLFAVELHHSDSSPPDTNAAFGLQLETTPEGTPRIVNVSTNITLLEDDHLDFSPGVSGQGPIYYHWYKDGALLPSQTNQSLRISAVSPGDKGLYRLLTSNALNTVWSHPVGLTVIGSRSPGNQDRTFKAIISKVPGRPVASVTALKSLSDGRIVAAGAFNRVNGVSNYVGLVRLTRSGEIDSTFQPAPFIDLLGDSRVRCIAETLDKNILIGGNFSSFGTNKVSGIFQLLPSGALDPNFHIPSFEPSAPLRIYVIVVLKDGKMLVGGEFSLKVGDHNLNALVRLNKDGSPDSTFIHQIRLDCGVRAIIPFDDGSVLVGGLGLSLKNYPGFLDTDLLKFTADGNFDSSFPLLTNIVVVSSMVKDTQGRIYVCSGSEIVRREIWTLSRLEPTGLFDATFTPWIFQSSRIVTTIHPQLDGQLIVGGAPILRTDSSGRIDPTFDSPNPAPPTSTVPILEPTEDGNILVGGEFDAYNYFTSGALVRIIAEPMPPRLKIERIGENTVVVSWPDFEKPYLLRRSLSIDNPVWQPISLPARLVDGRFWSTNFIDFLPTYFQVGFANP